MTRSVSALASPQHRGLTVFYAIAAVVGSVAPWVLFGSYFSRSGLDLAGFCADLFVNGAAGGFALDVLISIVVFLIWSWSDARRLAVKHWWAVLPLCLLIGLSSALPVYLMLRSHRLFSSPVGA